VLDTLHNFKKQYETCTDSVLNNFPVIFPQYLSIQGNWILAGELLFDLSFMSTSSQIATLLRIYPCLLQWMHSLKLV